MRQEIGNEKRTATKRELQRKVFRVHYVVSKKNFFPPKVTEVIETRRKD